MTCDINYPNLTTDGNPEELHAKFTTSNETKEKGKGPSGVRISGLNPIFEASVLSVAKGCLLLIRKRERRQASLTAPFCAQIHVGGQEGKAMWVCAPGYRITCAVTHLSLLWGSQQQGKLSCCCAWLCCTHLLEATLHVMPHPYMVQLLNIGWSVCSFYFNQYIGEWKMQEMLYTVKNPSHSHWTLLEEWRVNINEKSYNFLKTSSGVSSFILFFHLLCFQQNNVAFRRKNKLFWLLKKD